MSQYTWYRLWVILIHKKSISVRLKCPVLSSLVRFSVLVKLCDVQQILLVVNDGHHDMRWKAGNIDGTVVVIGVRALLDTLPPASTFHSGNCLR